jgi:hypothetical protein
MVEQYRKGLQVSTTADLRAERQIQTMAIIPDWCESKLHQVLRINTDSQFLRPTYPGQLHTIRKNTWNVILVLDLSLATSLETITQQIAHMIQRGIPLRFGVLPMFDPIANDIGTS